MARKIAGGFGNQAAIALALACVLMPVARAEDLGAPAARRSATIEKASRLYEQHSCGRIQRGSRIPDRLLTLPKKGPVTLQTHDAQTATTETIVAILHNIPFMT